MKTSIFVKTSMEIVLPTLPNFVRTPNKDVVMPIEDLTEEQVREIGKRWTNALVQKFFAKRKERGLAVSKANR